MSPFSKVIMVPGQQEIAKVNRKTKVLYLSDDVWRGLPAAEKEFVLLHEAGHLNLQTANEYAANHYAVSKFTAAGTFYNKNLGQKLMVMRSALDKADGVTSPFAAELALGAISPILQSLEMFGVGSKSRQKEAAANAEAAAKIYGAEAEAAAKKSKGYLTAGIIAGVFLILGIVIYFTLKK